MPTAAHSKVIDSERLAVSRETLPEKKARLGQFLTPAKLAAFMADLLPLEGEEVRLLDAGAGLGALSVAVLERRADASITAYEIDEALLPSLRRNLGPHARIEPLDFLQQAVYDLKLGRALIYTHAILNPPYKKIASASAYRGLLRKVGIETVNLYAGFVALALRLLRPGGHLCAIMPRSFCSGPYYRSFRQLILKEAAICRLHLFEARDRAFADDGVLQENVILLLKKGASQGKVQLSFSADTEFNDFRLFDADFERIVISSDPDQIIHVPTDAEAFSNAFQNKISDLGIEVSTGPVVDFRLKEHLRSVPGEDTVPLLYPAHFENAMVRWPRAEFRKSNAIVRNAQTEKWLLPAGDYAVVRRFSSKEEKRRVVASLLPSDFSRESMVGIENHLNVFHRGKRGLGRQLALGLVTYLNSSAVDQHFRMFNGHTQVNASDLKMLRYPTMQKLAALGAWAALYPGANQAAIDDIVSECA
jgi:adenine-specific DNA-methyltransferase